MFRAFADESEEEVFLIGAWVASVETWNALEETWLAELQASPSIRYFSHHESKALRGEFDGWDAHSANQKTLSLAKVICANKPLYGITSGLIVSKLKTNLKKVDVPKRKLRSIGVPTEPYEYCAVNLVCRVLQVQLERNMHERIDFVFDDHSLFEKLSSMYRRLKVEMLDAAQKGIAGTITTGDDRSVAGLQMADLLAGQVTCSLRHGRHEPPLKLLRDNIDILLSPTPLPTHVGADELFELMNAMWSVLTATKTKR